eukprot:5360123-Alexandrium_andersonii.AAC.1
MCACASSGSACPSASVSEIPKCWTIPESDKTNSERPPRHPPSNPEGFANVNITIALALWPSVSGCLWLSLAVSGCLWLSLFIEC